VHAAEIPVLEQSFGRVRVIAGGWRFDGRSLEGPLDRLAAEAGVAELQLQPGAGVTLEVPAANSLSVYVFEGALAAPRAVTRGHLAITGEGDALRLRAGEAGARALLLKGRPLREPVVSYGPFVMNTQQQIEEAIRDYREGRLAG
jgi:hypothetical protein